MVRGGDDREAGQHVVMPVRRVHDLHPSRVDRLAGAGTSEHAVLEEELNGPIGGGAGLRVTGRLGVLVKPPRSAVRLVERRAVAAGPAVAVPAAVRPLPGDDGLRQPLRPGIVGEPEARARAESVAVDARVRPREPVGTSATSAEIAADPIQHVVGCCRDSWVVGGCVELGQRDQPPVGARPLAVRVAPEPAVLLLTGQQRRHRRPATICARSSSEDSPEQVPSRKVSDRRLVAAEQPPHRVRGPLVHAGQHPRSDTSRPSVVRRAAATSG